MKPEAVDRLTKPEELRTIMKRAKGRGAEEIYLRAFRRLCDLEGMDLEDPLERDFHQVLAAYEQLLTEKNGRTTKANRTRQKLLKKGVEQCLIDWAVGQPAEGFKLLVGKSMPELTAEYLVLKYADRFSPNVVQSARRRLENEGVSDLPS